MTIQRSNTPSTYSASLSQKRKDSVVNGIKVNELVELFEDELKYSCKLNAEIMGTSGTLHTFDIVARKDSERIVIDLIQLRASVLDSWVAETVTLKQLTMAGVAMRAKSWDCRSPLAIIIRLSSYLSSSTSSGLDWKRNGENSGLREFFDQFNIKLIEASDIRTASKKLREFLLAPEDVTQD